jgi:hypothetical protein
MRLHDQHRGNAASFTNATHCVEKIASWRLSRRIDPTQEIDMKSSAYILGLVIAMGMATAASPAAATVHHSAPVHHRAAGPWHSNDEICDESDASQLYDWSRGVRNNPCWPCVSGDESTTSAYPSWEVRPNCD